MSTIDEVLAMLAVPPVRRMETRETTVSVCQLAGCGAEFPDRPEQQTWVQVMLYGRTGQWMLYFCSWAHLAGYATAAGDLAAALKGGQQ